MIRSSGPSARVTPASLAALVAVVLTAFLNPAVLAQQSDRWPAWAGFADRFVTADGRVVDLTFGGKSTSEGQSYGLFFALVANDRARFDAMLGWTSANLAEGHLGEKLPAWFWARRDDGSWGVKDRNSASDADLWLAYTLMEAGRLWKEPRYDRVGRALLQQVGKLEIADPSGSHPILLPAPVGFALDRGRYRIDPSYLPGFMFRYLATVDPEGPWRKVWNNYLRQSAGAFAGGFAEDTVIVEADGRWSPDVDQGSIGSYDAIRVYLWAGLCPTCNPELLRQLAPYAQLIRKQGNPPEKIDARNGVPLGGGFSPVGFSGALLPFLSALGQRDLLETQVLRIRLESRSAGSGSPSNYYDQALILFGQGWLDREYGFGANCELLTGWARTSHDPV